MDPKYERIRELAKAGRAKSGCPILPLDGGHALLGENRVINFCSSDHLGLSQHPDIKKQALSAILHHGVGGSLNCRSACELEAKLAEWLGTEAALFFPSILHAHTYILSTLADEKTAVFVSDKASSFPVKAKVYSDLADLEKLLECEPLQSRIVIAEGIGSVYGDLAPIEPLISLCNAHEALFYLDESEMIGMGGQKNGIDLLIGGFETSLGAVGAYFAGKRVIRELICSMNEIPLPFGVLGTIRGILDTIPHMEGERQQLLQRVHWVRHQLKHADIPFVPSQHHILFLPMGGEEEALHCWHLLLESGILVDRVGSGLRLRFSLLHTLDELGQLIEVLTNSRALKIS